MTPASEVKVTVRLLRILSFAVKLVVGTSFAEKQAHASFIEAAQIVGALLMYLVAVGFGGLAETLATNLFPHTAYYC